MPNKKSFKPYHINTRKTKQDVDLTPIYIIIENSAESHQRSPINNQFLCAISRLKTFSANKDSFALNFNFILPPFWSHDTNSWLALCDAKFDIAGIEAPVLKFMTILKTLTSGQLEKLYDIPKP